MTGGRFLTVGLIANACAILFGSFAVARFNLWSTSVLFVVAFLIPVGIVFVSIGFFLRQALDVYQARNLLISSLAVGLFTVFLVFAAYGSYLDANTACSPTDSMTLPRCLEAQGKLPIVQVLFVGIISPGIALATAVLRLWKEVKLPPAQSQNVTDLQRVP